MNKGKWARSIADLGETMTAEKVITRFNEEMIEFYVALLGKPNKHRFEEAAFELADMMNFYYVGLSKDIAEKPAIDMRRAVMRAAKELNLTWDTAQVFAVCKNQFYNRVLEEKKQD